MGVEPFDEAIDPVVRKLLGLELDLPSFFEFARRDPVLAEAVRLLPGFRPPLAPDAFQALVSSITAQQVSLHSALCTLRAALARDGVAPSLGGSETSLRPSSLKPDATSQMPRRVSKLRPISGSG